MSTKTQVGTVTASPQEKRPSQQPQLLTLALSRINVREDFNYREIGTPEFEAFAEHVRENGILQPVLVKPDPSESGGFTLVDGERRYRAACVAGLIEVPALLRFDTDERSDGLSEAIAANWFREDPNPIELAQGLTRMIQSGWSRKRLAAHYRIGAEELRQLLDLLALPDDVQQVYARRLAPMKIVRPLARIARVHSVLASRTYGLLAGSVSPMYYRRPTTDELVSDPADVASSIAPSALPDDIYRVGCKYPTSRFTLTDAASKFAAEIEVLSDTAGETLHITFDDGDLEYATTIRAAFGKLLIGQDTADLLAEVALARQLQTVQERHERTDAVHATRGTVATAETQEQATARRRAEREKARREAIRAARANHELAIHVERSFERVAPDKRVLKVLSALNVNNDLRELACRGARYGFAGWTRWETLKNGKDRVIYLEPPEAAQKARKYLAGATTLKQLAGRQLALVVMAMLANEIALPQSRRFGGGFTARTGGETLPWSTEVEMLLAELAIEHLPADFTRELQKKWDADQAQKARRAAFDAAVTAIEKALKRGDLVVVDEQLDVIARIPQHSVPKLLRREIAAARKRLAPRAADSAPEDDAAQGEVVAAAA